MDALAQLRSLGLDVHYRQQAALQHADAHGHRLVGAVPYEHAGRNVFAYWTAPDVPAFLAHTQRVPPARAHFFELVRADAPQLLYLDVDGRGSPDDDTPRLAALTTLLRTALRTAFDVPLDDGDVFASTASVRGRLSLHVTVRCGHWFPGVAAAKAFAAWLRAAHGSQLLALGVDMTVYTANRVMRVLGSSKLRQVRPLVALRPRDASTPAAAARFWITHIPATDARPFPPLRYATPLVPQPSASAAASVPPAVLPATACVPTGVLHDALAFFADAHPTAVLRGAKDCGPRVLLDFSADAAPCRLAGRRHRGNRRYLVYSRADDSVRYMCLSAACRGRALVVVPPRCLL